MNKTKWIYREEPSNEMLEKLRQVLDYSDLFLKVCLQKGLNTPEKIQSFITPSAEHFHDPFLLHDMNHAVLRIEQAIAEQENILIYGDYDADGITSTALLTETLLALGAEVSYYIPNRFQDGYGPNVERYREFIQSGIDLIITVDNGVSGHEAIDYAASHEVDVIVTDHHDLPETLPDAHAIIHPRHPDAKYPFSDLAGVGVAYQLASALLPEMASEMLELVAIGTIADLVSLTGQNRLLVMAGIKQLQQTIRPGLRAIYQEAGIKDRAIDEESIAFQIAPRLNAIGRIGDANMAVKLLLTDDFEEADYLSRELEASNHERKKMVDQTYRAAKDLLKSQADPKDQVLILAKEEWHPGILGIVASRLVDEMAKPVILFAIDSETRLAKGSGRSISGFSLFKAGQENLDLFEAFGGHEMACGMTIHEDRLEDLRVAFNHAASDLETGIKYETIDLSLSVSDISIKSIKELDLLRPFGMDNEAPIFSFEQSHIKQFRAVGSQNKHLKLVISEAGSDLDGIAFGLGSYAEMISPEMPLKLSGSLAINEWNGHQKSQINVSDIQMPRPLLTDRRVGQLQKQFFTDEDAVYLIFDQKLRQRINEKFPHLNIFDTEDYREDKANNVHKIIVIDLPGTLEELKKMIEQYPESLFILYLYQPFSWFLEGLPSRKECGKVYQYVSTHQMNSINEKIGALAEYLKMHKIKLISIIKMFEEAKFVKIINGDLIFTQEVKSVNLKNTEIYQALEQRLDVEQKLIYSDFETLRSHLISNHL